MALNKSKRVRSPDFTEEEIIIIRSSFIKHNKMLSAKHSNEVTQKEKDKIYRTITTEVNAVGVAERSLQSVKDKWQALKKSVKEKVTCVMREKKREREKTGGGENPTLDDTDVLDELNEDEKEILQVIPPEQIIGVNGGFATDEIVIVDEEELNVADDAHVNPITSESCPPNVTQAEKRKNPEITTKSVPNSSVMKRSKVKTTPMSSSEYYKEMIRIETEKLTVMKETLDIKKWYMEQKIALLREEQTTSPREDSQFFSHPPVAHSYEWRPSSRVRPASHAMPHDDAWNNNSF